MQGKVAVITGGARGIGRLTAQRLAGRGARVVIADVTPDAGEQTAREVSGRFVHLDVGDATQWGQVVDDVVAQEGRLDLVHLNAGVAAGVADVASVSVEEYRRVMSVNVDGVVFGVQAAVPHMSAGGAIVATASLGGLVPMASDPIYSLTKHAVVAFVRSIAPVYADRGITVNAVCPGFADTPLVTDEFRRMIAAMQVPLLDPSVVADTVIRIIDEGRTGEAWFVQPGREPAPYEFRGVPGPRAS